MGFLDGFMGGNEAENSKVSVLKELMNKENIESKTELSMKKIKVLFQLKLLYALDNKDKTEEEALNETLEYYLNLLVSKDRKGRIEITETLKKMPEEMPEQPVISGMMKK